MATSLGSNDHSARAIAASVALAGNQCRNIGFHINVVFLHSSARHVGNGKTCAELMDILKTRLRLNIIRCGARASRSV